MEADNSSLLSPGRIAEAEKATKWGLNPMPSYTSKPEGKQLELDLIDLLLRHNSSAKIEDIPWSQLRLVFHPRIVDEIEGITKMFQEIAYLVLKYEYTGPEDPRLIMRACRRRIVEASFEPRPFRYFGGGHADAGAILRNLRMILEKLKAQEMELIAPRKNTDKVATEDTWDDHPHVENLRSIDSSIEGINSLIYYNEILSPRVLDVETPWRSDSTDPLQILRQRLPPPLGIHRDRRTLTIIENYEDFEEDISYPGFDLVSPSSTVTDDLNSRRSYIPLSTGALALLQSSRAGIKLFLYDRNSLFLIVFIFAVASAMLAGMAFFNPDSPVYAAISQLFRVYASLWCLLIPLFRDKTLPIWPARGWLYGSVIISAAVSVLAVVLCSVDERWSGLVTCIGDFATLAATVLLAMVVVNSVKGGTGSRDKERTE
ncbi:hypothetical protein ABW21_db0209242 [Orbilia brochopaga]|nr:hypothetical protein ABW21_db0209242 [Drechslerella brochopaga]